mmetsp:Transcript_24556/g.52304  ORF Transcript_24556/g.52304 Transcript_24556/m.52304 type:complete len:121 (-) Transcript_24556:60-422(-)
MRYHARRDETGRARHRHGHGEGGVPETPAGRRDTPGGTTPSLPVRARKRERDRVADRGRDGARSPATNPAEASLFPCVRAPRTALARTEVSDFEGKKRVPHHNYYFYTTPCHTQRGRVAL